METRDYAADLQRNIEIARGYAKWADDQLLSGRTATIDWGSRPESTLILQRVDATSTYYGALRLLEDAGTSYAVEALLRVLLEHLAQVSWILHGIQGESDARTPGQRALCLVYGMAAQHERQLVKTSPAILTGDADADAVREHHAAMKAEHTGCPIPNCKGRDYRVEATLKALSQPVYHALWMRTSSAVHGFLQSRLLRVELDFTYLGEPAPLRQRVSSLRWVLLVYMSLIHEIATVENPGIVRALDRTVDDFLDNFMQPLLDAVMTSNG